MSDWIDAGETNGCARPDEKGCVIGMIFFIVLAVVVFIVLPLLF